ncbi:hypothetical protein C0J52_25021 [Blattella germanica]|nr:hypothetical protein C0J52_25021 [Blattella germanica]
MFHIASMTSGTINFRYPKYQLSVHLPSPIISDNRCSTVLIFCKCSMSASTALLKL